MNQELTQFKWLNNQNNWLFILEDGKKIRTISVDTTPPREIQFANLAEKRVCTCFSWNFDGSQLALVIDERQIYLWDVKLNQFNHYKRPNRDTGNGGSLGGGIHGSSGNQSSGKRSRTSAICLIAWSMVTNKLVICSSGGQLTISDFTDPSSTSEKFIDNGSGLLRQVVRLEPCPHLDLFACVSETSEVLVMTFDGIAKYYVQADCLNYIKIRFSPPNENSLINVFGDTVSLYINHQRSKQQGSNNDTDSGQRRNFQSLTTNVINDMKSDTQKSFPASMVSLIWVSYQSEEGRLKFKRIVFNFETSETSSEPDICFDHFDPSFYSTQKHSASPYEDNESDKLENDSPLLHQTRSMNIAKLIDHFWINQSSLLCCDSAGTMKLLEIKQSDVIKFYPPIVHILLNIRSDTETILSPLSLSGPDWPSFKAYDFRLNSKRNKDRRAKTVLDNQKAKINESDEDASNEPTNVLAIAAITSSEIFYYELIWSKDTDNSDVSLVKRVMMGYHSQEDDYKDERQAANLSSRISLERVDDLDLGLNLQKFQLDLEQVAWSYDCSMLAVQLTGGYMLAYRTHLDNYLIARCGPKTSQLSTPTEITVLNFQVYPDQMMTSAIASPSSLRTASSASSSTNNPASRSAQSNQARSKQALVVNVPMKPSILAIGPCHLAVGLNNRVRLYQTARHVESESDDASGVNNHQPEQQQQLLDEAKLVAELDYSSIIAKIELNSGFIATLFMDGRLKLTSIPISSPSFDGVKERTFPDPGQRFERISGFCLTENIFLYCTEISLKLQVFCLQRWSLIQQCDITRLVENPIMRFRANEQGNKFACLLKKNRYPDHELESKVFLYDLNSNKLIKINHRLQQQKLDQYNLFRGILASQIKSAHLTSGLLNQEDNQNFKARIMKSILNSQPFAVVRFGRIEDAIWDTDGRNLILIERRLLHNIAILEHTLDTTIDGGITIEHVASMTKAYNNEPVYLTQGVVSYQTKLGRMINSILYLHDDDLRLINLERQIAEIQLRINEEEAYYEEIISSKRKNLEQQEQSSVKDDQLSDSDAVANKGIDSDLDDRPLSESEQTERLTREACDNLRSLYTRAELELMRLKVSYLLTILPIYSLNRCKCILEHIATDEQFNLVPPKMINDSNATNITSSNPNHSSMICWRILAAWSMYTMNLNFALMIYRKSKLMIHAMWLTNLIRNLHNRDSSQSTRILVLAELLELSPNVISRKD